MHGLRVRVRMTLAGLFVCLSALAVVAAEPPKPNPADPVDYIEWINQTMGGAVKDNAYDAYLAAYKQLKPFDGDWGKTLDGPWSESENPAAAKWLDNNRKGLDLFRTAANKPECFFKIEVPEGSKDPRMARATLNILVPFMGSHRNACKALVAEGYRAWPKGNHDLLLTNALVMLRAAHHLDHHPVLIARLVGWACAQQAYDRALRPALALTKDPFSLTADTLSKLEAADPVFTPTQEAFLFERILVWDSCQRVFVPGEKEGTWKLYEPAFEGPTQVFGPDDKAALLRIGFDKTLAEINGYFDEVDRCCRMPFPRAASRTKALEDRASGSKNPLVKTMLPSLSRYRAIHERIAAYRCATHLIFHLFAHHAKQGTFPDSLADLAGDNIKKLRTDPFSGKDFVYKKDKDGKGFVLYTVGPDFKDDGGKHNEKIWEGEQKEQAGDFVFWPVQQSR